MALQTSSMSLRGVQVKPGATNVYGRSIAPVRPSLRQAVRSKVKGSPPKPLQGSRSSVPTIDARLRPSSFGSATRSSSASAAQAKALYGGKPYIAIAACRRGRTLVVAAALAGVEDAVDVTTLLQQPLSSHKSLVQGQLDNGLRYVIMPNKTPPQRLEAHLEVHAGSVDERNDEQGLAHLVEHVTFLGSRKREALLGTGARANAYTDFHHTVFHTHAPLTSAINGMPMLPQVLEALEDIAFKPQFLPLRIDKERKAVMAEAQMMNTMEYRVDCQLLQYLHHENNLGCRFPIGKMEQVTAWPNEQVRAFWERWYFPANCTLYVVGDFDRSTEEVEALIQKVFGKIPAALEAPAAPAGDTSATSEAPLKERHGVRPPVTHMFGVGPLQANEGPAPVSIFQHPLLQNFMLTIFCKTPIYQLKTVEDLRRMFMIRIILCVFEFRINNRYVSSASPPFMGIDIDISDSGREGTGVSCITITANPSTWKEAVQVAVEESRRLQRFGVTANELERYKVALLRDSDQQAEQANSIPHLENLDFVMEALALGNVVMDHVEANQTLKQLADTVTLDDINAVCASMMAFMSDYGNEGAVLQQAEQEQGAWAWPGPTRATSIVACVPSFVDSSGESVAAGKGTARVGSVGTLGHIDPDEVDLEELAAQAAAEEFDIPEGAVKFDLTAEAVQAVLADQSYQVEAAEDIECPDTLVPEEQVASKMAALQPFFIAPDASSSAAPIAEVLPGPDAYSGIVLRQLSNGIKINYRHTDNEPKSGLIRVVATGGRMTEPLVPDGAGIGAVTVGARTLAESGTAGDWSREQFSVFCIQNLLNCMLQADEEFVVMDVYYALGEAGLRAALELVHCVLDKPQWDDDALERAKEVYHTSAKTVTKSLERGSSDRIMSAMLGPDRRFQDPSSEEVDALTLEGVKARVAAQLHAGNIEVNIVGDLEGVAVDDLCLKYLGTVAPLAEPPVLDISTPVLQSPARDQRNLVWHLQDSDERAIAYIAGPAPCRWGALGSNEPLPALGQSIVTPYAVPFSAPAAEKEKAKEVRRAHPLYPTVTLLLLSEIVNSRLFTKVRDSLGLTYDVSFAVNMFDMIRAGWFSVQVTSYPDKIYDALYASVSVLRELRTSIITDRDLQRAKRTLLTRHESDLKTNVYWLGLLTHLQNSKVPYKNLECLRDLNAVYDAVRVEDIYHAASHFDFSDASIFTCIGTSGRSQPPVPEKISPDVAAMCAAPMEAEQPPQGWAQQVQQPQQPQQPQQQAAAAQQQPGQPGQQELDPVAAMTAMFSAMKSMNLVKAVQYMKGQEAQQQAEQQGQQQEQQR